MAMFTLNYVPREGKYSSRLRERQKNEVVTGIHLDIYPTNHITTIMLNAIRYDKEKTTTNDFLVA
jgi:hypothetical protein